MPWRLCIDVECLIILRASLAAVAPEEGCALLIGESSVGVVDSSGVALLQRVEAWAFGLPGTGGQTVLPIPWSCHHAARDLCSTHVSKSQHNAGQGPVVGRCWAAPIPIQGGQPVPSAIDRRWAAAAGVMLIDAGRGGLAAWWLQGPAPDAVHALPLVTCHTIPA